MFQPVGGALSAFDGEESFFQEEGCGSACVEVNHEYEPGFARRFSSTKLKATNWRVCLATRAVGRQPTGQS